MIDRDTLELNLKRSRFNKIVDLGKKVMPTGGSSDSPSEDRSASPPRGNARPHLRGESDLVTDEALETAEAVA